MREFGDKKEREAPHKMPCKEAHDKMLEKEFENNNGLIQMMPKITLMFMNPEESRSREADRREPSTAWHLRN